MKKRIYSLILIISLLISSVILPARASEEDEQAAESPLSCCGTDPALIQEGHNALVQKRTNDLQKELNVGVQPFSLFPDNGSIYSNFRGITPSTGDVKLLVLPIAFPDYPQYEAEYDEETLRNHYFAPYDPQQEVRKSVRSFFYHSSFGKMKISGDVLPVYNSPDESTCYTYGDSPADWSGLIKTALKYYADNGWNLSEYDGDGDGYLDALAVKFLRPTDSDFWWSYKRALPLNTEINGIKVKQYTHTSIARDVRTDVHEMAHMLGLPDNYDVNGGQCVIDDAVEELMYTGYYINVYYKYLLEWIDPVILTNADEVKEVELYAAEKYTENLENEPKAYLLIPDPFMLPFTEYYIAEYRVGGISYSQYREVFKKRPGIVIWHINSHVYSDGSYINRTSFIKPVYKSGIEPLYDVKDIYVAGDVFSSSKDAPVNSDFYGDIYTGAYLEVTNIDKENGKATIKAGFVEPDTTPAPMITMVTPPSKTAVKTGDTLTFEIGYFANGEWLPFDSKVFGTSSTGYREMILTGTANYDGLRTASNPSVFTLNKFSGDGTFGFTIRAGAVTYGGKSSRETSFENLFYIDNTPPEIAIKGDDTVTLEKGTPYTESGANVTDNLDPEIEDKLQIDATGVNINKAGTYTVTYNLTDHAGNEAEPVERTVIVQDTVAPTATIAYSTTEPTAGDVTATLIPSEEVTVTNNDGKRTYTFTDNGSFTFEFKDPSGNTGTAIATVDWIDNSLPDGTITYDIESTTNQNVTATLHPSEEVTITSEGGNEHVFTENGSFTFSFTDLAGNEGSAVATVNNIDKTPPTAEVEYSETDPTNENVIAYLNPSEEITVTNNEGCDSYVFEENGTFTFNFEDTAGNTGTATATVNNIDKTPPTATVEYSETDPTNENVIAYLNPSEEITVTNNEGSSSYVFEENGTFTFNFEDTAGNTGTATATVNNIDKTPPTATVEYSETEPTSEDVTATITLSEPVEFTQNGDRLTPTENELVYTSEFTENDSFTIKFKDPAGNTGTKDIAVTWIDKTPPATPSPDPEASPSPSPSPSPDPEASPSPSPSPDPEASPLPSPSPDTEASPSPSPSPSTSPSPSPSPKPTTPTPKPTPSPSPSPKPTTYSVSFEYQGANGGENTENSRTVKAGEFIGKLPVPTRIGYTFGGWYTAENGKGTKYTSSSVIRSNATLYANWVYIPLPPAAEQFEDVPAGKWYGNAVSFAVKNELFTGTKENAFEPETKMTRAMFVTVLGRIAEQMGEKIPKANATFTDVKPGSYYDKYVKWASDNEIVKGYEDGTFKPDNNVSREEAAVLLMRFIDYKRITVPEGKAVVFKDENDISSFAKSAVTRATKAGILSGYEDGTFKPKNTSTRAEVAQVFYNFLTG